MTNRNVLEEKKRRELEEKVKNEREKEKNREEKERGHKGSGSCAVNSNYFCHKREGFQKRWRIAREYWVRLTPVQKKIKVQLYSYSASEFVFLISNSDTHPQEGTCSERLRAQSSENHLQDKKSPATPPHRVRKLRPVGKWCWVVFLHDSIEIRKRADDFCILKPQERNSWIIFERILKIWWRATLEQCSISLCARDEMQNDNFLKLLSYTSRCIIDIQLLVINVSEEPGSGFERSQQVNSKNFIGQWGCTSGILEISNLRPKQLKAMCIRLWK